MKKILSLLICLAPILLKAQSTKSDTAGIKEACLNYVQGFYTGDTARVAKGVHPELAKRIVMRRFQYKLRNMTATELIAAAGSGQKMPDPNPSEPFKADILVYDIDQEIATVKIITNKMKFFDYAQLGKVNGQWKVINVLWANYLKQ